MQVYRRSKNLVKHEDKLLSLYILSLKYLLHFINCSLPIIVIITLAYHGSNIGSSHSEKPYKHKGRENFPYNQHNTKANEFYIADITMKGCTVGGLLVFNFPLKDINNRSVCVTIINIFSIQSQSVDITMIIHAQCRLQYCDLNVTVSA